MNLYPYLPSFHLIWLKFVQNSAGRLWPSWNQGQLRRCMTLIRALMVLWSVWYSDSTEQLDKSVNCVLQHTACSFNRGGVCLLRGTDWCPKCNSCCNWSAVAQAVCRRPVTTETQIRSQDSPCVIRGLHWFRFFSEYFGLLLSISLHQYTIFVFIHILFLTEWQTGETWGPCTSRIGEHRTGNCFIWLLLET